MQDMNECKINDSELAWEMGQIRVLLQEKKQPIKGRKRNCLLIIISQKSLKFGR